MWNRKAILGSGSFLLALITGFILVLSSLGASQPPADVERNKMAPPRPRDEIDLWESIEGKSLKPGDPLLTWRDAQRTYLQHARNLEKLSREQNALSEQLRNETTGIKPGRPTIPEIPKLHERRKLISALHENAQAVDREEKAIREAAKPVAEEATEIAQRMSDILQDLDRKIQDFPAEGPGGKKRFLERQRDRIVMLVRLLEEVQADPEQGVEKVVDSFRRSAFFRERRGGQGVMIHQMREQVENLEREQVFLKQRLENHEESLKMLRAQLDFLSESSRHRLEDDAATTASVQSSRLLLPQKSGK